MSRSLLCCRLCLTQIINGEKTRIKTALFRYKRQKNVFAQYRHNMRPFQSCAALTLALTLTMAFELFKVKNGTRVTAALGNIQPNLVHSMPFVFDIG